MPDVPAIGARIRALRKARQLTLAEVSARCGLSVTHLSDLERQRVAPSLKTVNRIAAALETSAAELLEECPTWSPRFAALERVAQAAARHQRRYLLTSPEANDLAAALLELAATGWEADTDGA